MGEKIVFMSTVSGWLMDYGLYNFYLHSKTDTTLDMLNLLELAAIRRHRPTRGGNGRQDVRPLKLYSNSPPQLKHGRQLLFGKTHQLMKQLLKCFLGQNLGKEICKVVFCVDVSRNEDVFVS